MLCHVLGERKLLAVLYLLLGFYRSIQQADVGDPVKAVVGKVIIFIVIAISSCKGRITVYAARKRYSGSCPLLRNLSHSVFQYSRSFADNRLIFFIGFSHGDFITRIKPMDRIISAVKPQECIGNNPFDLVITGDITGKIISHHKAIPSVINQLFNQFPTRCPLS